MCFIGESDHLALISSLMKLDKTWFIKTKKKKLGKTRLNLHRYLRFVFLVGTFPETRTMVRCRCCCFLFRSEEERYHLSTNPIFSSDILFLLVFLFFFCSVLFWRIISDRPAGTRNHLAAMAAPRPTGFTGFYLVLLLFFLRVRRFLAVKYRVEQKKTSNRH